MKIEKQSTKLIKPFVPTPPTHSQYKLGLVDEFVVGVNVGVVLFFFTNSIINPKLIARLENSLEKTLTRFYLLAGRYDDETKTICCNDQGAEFISAKVNIQLQDILVSEGNVNFIGEFIPSKNLLADRLKGPLLATQVTTFECGSLALGVSASHMVVDAFTLCTFLTEWAAVNKEENELDLTGRPGFESSPLLPSRGLYLTPNLIPHMSDDTSTKYIRKKYSFSEYVISKLKVNRKNNTRQWSKVQLASAIIWKAFMAIDRSTYGYCRESVFIQPINLREKMASFIPKNYCGNIWVFFITKATTDETIEELTDLLCDSVNKTVSEFSKAYHDSREGEILIWNYLTQLPSIDLKSTNMSGITSWCRFPFNESDFGFGKPIWVAPGTMPLQNSAFVMDDSKGNGLDAYVLLEVKDVQIFEDALKKVKPFTA